MFQKPIITVEVLIMNMFGSQWKHNLYIFLDTLEITL